ncbi:hypothetical protein FRC14_000258 [Serendipita sp. 396]|nr:hypothetical protein FRC14_000258 [Serendipita sp. 396]KAG8775050.1 hypothetical protein FRC15_000826 [Serendipita sp. 397]KAG8790192.1 hypothetical protein FRC16_000994 [Serendipita sp. 398]KAG8854760.1 hypothetical protein FRC20_000925 [Serendipita sp. 405]
MANASAKRTAAANEAALRNLRILMIFIPTLSLFLRYFFRFSLFFPSSDSRPLRITLSSPFPTKTSLFIHLITFVPVMVLYSHLTSIGSPKRDKTTGALISSGEDLNMTGVTEWCWDIIYVTWACQVGSALVGEWFWWAYLCIPLFALWKIYSVFIKPYYLSGSREDKSDVPNDQETSKRQQKLKKRSEKGDPRVKRL